MESLHDGNCFAVTVVVGVTLKSLHMVTVAGDDIRDDTADFVVNQQEVPTSFMQKLVKMFERLEVSITPRV